MGDSITENWGLADPALFDGEVANRGISGQTTAQMLVRFRADVVALRPQTVHILAGTNDVAGNTGPMSAQDFKNNIMSMVDCAPECDFGRARQHSADREARVAARGEARADDQGAE